jgi:hypothetical protein
MATAQQIAANRANAKKSTGPRSPTGLARSSRNALSHGLSLPLSQNELGTAEALAKALSACPGEGLAAELAKAHVEISRARQARTHALEELLESLNLPVDPNDRARSIKKIERYERLAAQKRRRAVARLFA